MLFEQLYKKSATSERFLPSGYTVDELKEMNEDSLAEVCARQALDVASVQVYLRKAQRLDSEDGKKSVTATETIHPDQVLLARFLAEMSKSTPEVTFNVQELRERREGLKNDPHIKNPEAHADTLYRNQILLNGDNSPQYRAGVSDLYKGVLASVGIEAFETAVARGSTTVEALEFAKTIVAEKFYSKNENQLWVEAFRWVLSQFQYTVNTDQARFEFCQLVKKVIEKTASSKETATVNQLLRAVKGEFFRPGHTTETFPKRFESLRRDLAIVYQASLPTQAMSNSTEVTAGDVFDAHYHAVPLESGSTTVDLDYEEPLR